jgi:hypothetical protein
MCASKAQYTNRLLRLQVALRTREPARTMDSNAHCGVTIQVHAGMHPSSCLARLNGRPTVFNRLVREGKGIKKGRKKEKKNGKLDRSTETDRRTGAHKMNL